LPSIIDALQQSPPGPNGATTNPCQNFVTAVEPTASTVELALPEGGGIPETGCYITWVSTVDCHLRVGRDSIGDSTTSDFFLAGGVEKNWWHDPRIETHFSAIRADSATANGLITRYRSQRR